MDASADASKESSISNEESDKHQSSTKNRYPINNELQNQQPKNPSRENSRGRRWRQVSDEKYACILACRLNRMNPEEREVQQSSLQGDATSISIGGGDVERAGFNFSSMMETFWMFSQILEMQSSMSSEALNNNIVDSNSTRLEPTHSRSMISHHEMGGNHNDEVLWQAEESAIVEAPFLQKRKSCDVDEKDASWSSFHRGKKQREDENDSSSSDEDY